VVGPGGVHTSRNSGDLNYPTGTQSPSENKRQSRKLSNLAAARDAYHARRKQKQARASKQKAGRS